MSFKLALRLALAGLIAGVVPACGNINDGHPAVPFTSRASVSTLGAQSDQPCGNASISGNGRFVVFSSAGSTLDQAGPPNIRQVFRRNLMTGVMEMVSVDPTLTPGDDESFHPVVSFDGRYVAFESFATNLLAAPQGPGHVYVRDMNAPALTATALVSQNQIGDPGDDASSTPSISNDGQFIAFSSLATNFGDSHSSGLAKIYRRDMLSGEVIPVSVTPLGDDPSGGADGSITPSISADGSVIAFASDCVDVVAGDSNNKKDVFVAVVDTGVVISTVLASPKLGGGFANGDSDAPAMSADGLFVAFQSDATNLIPTDANGTSDVFLYSMAAGSLELISVNSQGVQAELISNNLNPSVSGDGRFVAFDSVASNLIGGDTNVTTDVFVRDTFLGTTVRVSVDTAGNQSGITMPSSLPSLSADGKAVAFVSMASFVKDDSNGLLDVYVRAPLR